MNLTCSPGQQATAAYMRVSGLPTLVAFLDPGNIAFQLPPHVDGAAALAKFCRELAREATKLADVLEESTGLGPGTGEPT